LKKKNNDEFILEDISKYLTSLKGLIIYIQVAIDQN
jgi:hypothetical protein